MWIFLTFNKLTYILNMLIVFIHVYVKRTFKYPFMSIPSFSEISNQF